MVNLARNTVVNRISDSYLEKFDNLFLKFWNNVNDFALNLFLVLLAKGQLISKCLVSSILPKNKFDLRYHKVCLKKTVAQPSFLSKVLSFLLKSKQSQRK